MSPKFCFVSSSPSSAACWLAMVMVRGKMTLYNYIALKILLAKNPAELSLEFLQSFTQIYAPSFIISSYDEKATVVLCLGRIFIRLGIFYFQERHLRCRNASKQTKGKGTFKYHMTVF